MRHTKFVFILIITLLSIFVSDGFCDYKIISSTIDGGGRQSTGGQYKLIGTIGQPDAGYSYSGNYELFGGFMTGGALGIIDFFDYSLFAIHWLQNGCNTGNAWCDGADLDNLGSVDFADLAILADHWLAVEPPGWPLK